MIIEIKLSLYQCDKCKTNIVQTTLPYGWRSSIDKHYCENCIKDCEKCNGEGYIGIELKYPYRETTPIKCEYCVGGKVLK